MTDLLETSKALIEGIHDYLPVEVTSEIVAHLAPELEEVARAIKLTEEQERICGEVSASLGE